MVSNSPAEENYLKAIYHLQLHTEVVSTNNLARQLHTKPASVTDMMKRLSAKKLLHYTPYHGFSLSAEGRRAALLIVRRHRLWEYFLAEKLAFGWDEVHEIAEELEHVCNSKLIDKLDAYLGYPRFDPHGDPIPDGRGKVAQPQLVSLSALPTATPAQLHTVTDQSRELLEHLAARSIVPGCRVEVKSRSPFDQSIEIRIKNKLLTITALVADRLLVKTL